ncbi:hypothetical protein AI2943V1_1472 [Klebsiella oxytoca]|nr:hypothetical protein AI2943V1_1472 [Klebsiella oxytoca]CAH5643909.1 hypothetical protein AI2943V1_1472 [Klebsiella oxytoca]
MTSKLARERLAKIKSWRETYGAGSNVMLPAEEAEELARIALAVMDGEPVAYMTYKGYLLHAGDPKLAEYSEPTPLYADPRTAAMPAAPVAWLWSRDDERDVSLTPPDDDDDAADAIECGWTATPLYRHAQQPVVQPVMFIDGDISTEDADKLAKVIREFNEEDERPLAKMARIIRENPHPTNECDMPKAQPAPVVPEGLNPETTDLVLRFASALADKLYKAEQKYGRSTDWMKDDWYDDCLQSLWEHIEKGDPRDVAAYCAFMWYHGWVTTDYDRNVQNACRAAMLAAAPQEVKGE